MPSGLKNRSKWAVKCLNWMCFACARACTVIYCRSGGISKKWCRAFGNQTNKYMLCLFCPPTLPFRPPLYLPPHQPHRTRIRMRCMSMVTASYAGSGRPNGCSSRVGPWVWGLPATSAPRDSQRRHWSLPLPSLRDVGDQHWWRGVMLGMEGNIVVICSQSFGCPISHHFLSPPLYLPQYRPHRTCIHVRCVSTVTTSYAGGGQPNGCSSGVGPRVWGLSATSALCE